MNTHSLTFAASGLSRAAARFLAPGLLAATTLVGTLGISSVASADEVIAGPVVQQRVTFAGAPVREIVVRPPYLHRHVVTVAPAYYGPSWYGGWGGPSWYGRAGWGGFHGGFANGGFHGGGFNHGGGFHGGGFSHGGGFHGGGHGR